MSKGLIVTHRQTFSTHIPQHRLSTCSWNWLLIRTRLLVSHGTNEVKPDGRCTVTKLNHTPGKPIHSLKLLRREVIRQVYGVSISHLKSQFKQNKHAISWGLSVSLVLSLLPTRPQEKILRSRPTTHKHFAKSGTSKFMTTAHHGKVKQTNKKNWASRPTSEMFGDLVT